MLREALHSRFITFDSTESVYVKRFLRTASSTPQERLSFYLDFSSANMARNVWNERYHVLDLLAICQSKDLSALSYLLKTFRFLQRSRKIF